MKEECLDISIPVRARADDGFALAESNGCDYIDDIIAAQPRPQVAKHFGGLLGCRTFWIRLEFADREILIVAQGEYICSCEKSGMTD